MTHLTYKHFLMCSTEFDECVTLNWVENTDLPEIFAMHVEASDFDDYRVCTMLSFDVESLVIAG